MLHLLHAKLSDVPRSIPSAKFSSEKNPNAHVNSGLGVSLRHGGFLGDYFNDESVLVVFRHVSACEELALLRDVEGTRHYRAARLLRAVLVQIRAGDVVMESAVVTDVQVGRRYLRHEVIYIRHRVHSGVIVAAFEDRWIVVLVQHAYRHVRVTVLRIVSQRSAGLRGVDVEIRIVGCENGQDVPVPDLAIEGFVRVDATVGFVHVEGVPFVS